LTFRAGPDRWARKWFFPFDFHGSSRAHQTLQNVKCFPGHLTLSPANLIQGLSKKEIQSTKKKKKEKKKKEKPLIFFFPFIFLAYKEEQKKKKDEEKNQKEKNKKKKKKRTTKKPLKKRL
jgi:hypothetical protein